jgi:hypothetical protein
MKFARLIFAIITIISQELLQKATIYHINYN